MRDGNAASPGLGCGGFEELKHECLAKAKGGISEISFGLCLALPPVQGLEAALQSSIGRGARRQFGAQGVGEGGRMGA